MGLVLGHPHQHQRTIFGHPVPARAGGGEGGGGEEERASVKVVEGVASLWMCSGN